MPTPGITQGAGTYRARIQGRGLSQDPVGTVAHRMIAGDRKGESLPPASAGRRACRVL